MLNSLNLLFFSRFPFHPPCHLIHAFAQSGFSRFFLWFHGCHNMFSFESCFIFIKCCSSRLNSSRISMSWNEVLKGTVISSFSPEILSFILSCLSSLLKLQFSYNLLTLLWTNVICSWELLRENDEERIYTCHIFAIDVFEIIYIS